MAEDPTDDGVDDAPRVPLGGTRAQAIQRLQIGLFGLGTMILMVGLANVILDRAKQADASAVPEAAATVAPSDKPAPKTDPLVDAGVVPELPTEPADHPTQGSQSLADQSTDAP